MTIHLEPRELQLAETVASFVGSRWKLVEVDDVTSHLYLWLCQNERHVAAWRAEGQGEGKLFVAMRREANKYAANETAARVGRPLTSTPMYPRDVVERALPFIFEDIPQTSVTVNPVTGQPDYLPHEFDVAIAVLFDIKGAFYGLPPRVREILEWKFRDGLTNAEIGALRNITKDGARKQIARALDRLVDALGSD